MSRFDERIGDILNKNKISGLRAVTDDREWFSVKLLGQEDSKDGAVRA